MPALPNMFLNWKVCNVEIISKGRERTFLESEFPECFWSPLFNPLSHLYIFVCHRFKKLVSCGYRGLIAPHSSQTHCVLFSQLCCVAAVYITPPRALSTYLRVTQYVLLNWKQDLSLGVTFIVRNMKCQEFSEYTNYLNTILETFHN